MSRRTRSPDLPSALARAREPLLRRFLGLVVERSSMEELAARPLGERMLDFELLLEAAKRESRIGADLPALAGARDAATVTRLYPRTGKMGA